MNVRSAVVIGAGIGGLTAAAALHRDGWEVTVLERAPSLEPVGAGIAIAPNAQRALDTLGIGDAVRAMAAFQGEGGLRRPSGRWLASGSSEAAAERFGGPVVVVHRPAVVDLLASLLPGGSVRTSSPARLADPGDRDRPARVVTEDGTFEAALVVAADGIHSPARSALFPGSPAPRYSGFTSWRLIAAAPKDPFRPAETWGRGQIFGTVPLPDGRVYCFATAALPAGLTAPDDERAELLRRFGGWHHPVPALVSSVTPGQVLRHDVYSMTAALPAHHRGRTALLGDAAHAMTPNLGQGGCQAIEDAVVLAHLLRCGPAGPEVLAGYTAERRPRTRAVVRRSARIAALTTWSSPPAVALRDLLIAVSGRLAPQLALRGLDGIADWRPPYAATHGGDGTAGGRAAGPGRDRTNGTGSGT